MSPGNYTNWCSSYSYRDGLNATAQTDGLEAMSPGNYTNWCSSYSYRDGLNATAQTDGLEAVLQTTCPQVITLTGVVVTLTVMG